MANKSKSWVKFDPAAVGAETPIKVRGENAEATVIISQHGQLLDAQTRRLVEWEAKEMCLEVAAEPVPEA
jgi:hypothetical protein